MPNADQTEYPGGIINNRTDPTVEIYNRIAGASYTWQPLKGFWKDGLLSRRGKPLMYDALVSSKLSYGLHKLPLKDALLNKLDEFYLKVFQRIFG